MLKSIITAVVGSRHERERKRIQPIVDAINEWDVKLQAVSESHIQGQTAKFKKVISDRTKDLEKRIADLKERKRTASDASEREKLDTEIGGADGRGGL